MGIWSKSNDVVAEKEVTVKEATNVDASTILRNKISQIADIDNEIAECEEHEMFKSTVENLKALKNSKKVLEAEVETTVKQNEHLLQGKGEVQVGGYRVRSSFKKEAFFTRDAKLEEIFKEESSILDVKLSKTGVGRIVKNPGGLEKLELLGVEFENVETIKVEKLKK